MYFINLPFLWKYSILSWTFDKPQNMGLVLWFLHASLSYLASSFSCLSFHLWALWDHSQWGLELNRNNILQNIKDVEGKSAEGPVV